MATQTPTQRRAAAKKAAATRKRNASSASARSTSRSARTTARSATTTASTRAQAEAKGLQALALQAERAVLIPVGAALTARDTVVESHGIAVLNRVWESGELLPTLGELDRPADWVTRVTKQPAAA